MKIGLFSPYVPTAVGGGEKYFFDTATSLAKHHAVTVGISGDSVDLVEIRATYESFLGYSLENISFVPCPLYTPMSNPLKTWQWTRQFDVFYFITDGSFPISGARRNILHIQTPLKISHKNPWSQFKASRWDVINTNSEFTRDIVERYWGIPVTVVHHPMIKLKRSLHSDDKEKIILHVGRFFQHLHSKRQDVLVEMFKQLHDVESKLSRGWKLVLVGRVDDEAYAKRIAKLAAGYPIEIEHTLDRKQLLKLLKKASIYWHATGVEADQYEQPELMEHFGISTVEAMAYGAVPVVIAKGGQPEAVGASLQQLTWLSPDEGIQTTKLLMKDTEQRARYAALAVEESKRFDRATFEDTLFAMVEGTA